MFDESNYFNVVKQRRYNPCRSWEQESELERNLSGPPQPKQFGLTPG